MPSCQRCTALLHGVQARCSLCGWPVGTAYPAVDGSLQPLAEVEEAVGEPEAEPEAEEVGLQLDALSAMVVRQHDRSAEGREEVSAVADAPPQEAEVATSSAPVAELVMAEAAVVATGSDTTRSEIALAPDPLTAPIEQIAELGERAALQMAPPNAPENTDSIDDLDFETELEAAVEFDAAEAAAPSDELPEEAGDAEAPPAHPAGLARLVQGLLLFVGVSSLLAAAYSWLTAPTDSASTAGGSLLLSLGLAMVTFAAWVATTAAFLVWVSRTHTQVVATSTVRQRHGSTMTVAGWFIPVYGFIVGWQVMQDLWVGSDPETRTSPPEKAPQPQLISLWLLTFVGAVVLGWVVPLALGGSAVLGVAGSVCLLASAVALGRVVTTIASWHSPTAVGEPSE